MRRNSRVLIDSSALYALVSSSDELHDVARHCYENLIDTYSEMYITSDVLVEISGTIHRRLGYPQLKIFWESIFTVVKLYLIDEPTYFEAWKLMASTDRKLLSLVDWTTIVTARRLGASVFCFDENITAEVFTLP